MLGARSAPAERRPRRLAKNKVYEGETMPAIGAREPLSWRTTRISGVTTA